MLAITESAPVEWASGVEAMQRGLGEAVRSWGGSAVLGVSTGLTRCGRRFRTQPLPMSDCRGSPHEQLPWFPP
ncbi:hypothetical protein [Moorena sp. SIO2C4]|uniref:hypothetical protein n=1 Tax=Moorena sp. SIO2C4 TaxID=2607824 RepID=UPI00257948D5|nr:hypothetical protein [Moorena sp. SIO2C4]